MDGNEKKILFVDDDESITNPIRSALFGSDIFVEFVQNGMGALEKITHDFFSVVVVDLNIHGMDCLGLVNRLNSLPNKPIILVSFKSGEINSVINLFQVGVYDYIQKPYRSVELLHRIQKALEVAEFRSINNQLETEKKKQVRKQSNLNLRKEKIINGNSDDSSDDQLIGNIRTSLSQGAGFGALVSLIKRIEKKAKRKGEDYIIDSSLMESLFENGQAAKRVINLFEEMENIGSNDLSEELLSLSDLHQTLEEILESQRELINLQNHSVVLGKNAIAEQNVFINGKLEYLRKAFEELLLNALKFSIPNARIYINLSKSPKSMKIDFLNPPNRDQYGNYGIPESYESLIFEPFFRMSRLVHERYPTLDFGLGLTYVDKVIRKHNGHIKSFLVKNQLDDLGASDFVHFEVDIPTVVLV
ncbi:hybrid sensor histidine kinase/response regulator [Leptospira ilyithenensis]|uniref:Hybrid sensor histidine kinase/response regulator n=1 Tax=Leptospira ilyithenensis TaxID=2484901 RepID=A0A4R9LNL0_9LEPT|nr:response regulator [Leptospira ilyithenensis]TGN10418.1 hybrid sensor histidine kinase/response regulator [Leptospira ilyithenensis]